MSPSAGRAWTSAKHRAAAHVRHFCNGPPIGGPFYLAIYLAIGLTIDDQPHLRAIAPAIERARVRTAWPSLPDWTTHWPFSRPTIFPTWCGQTTTAPFPAAAKAKIPLVGAEPQTETLSADQPDRCAADMPRLATM